jgi:hypothetical protein
MCNVENMHMLVYVIWNNVHSINKELYVYFTEYYTNYV